jgi:tyrosyl-tRNA synthetase
MTASNAASALDVLQARGFVYDISDESGLRQALQQSCTAYCGFDATRNSLQVGNLLQLMLLAHLQRAGHRPIALIGGGTTMIGDPSGKSEMREMLGPEQIQENARAIRGQVSRFLDFEQGQALMLNNADWLLGLGYIEFLRDVGRHFSVNQLLQHETYRERMSGEGLNFIELNYPLLQAYDFLHLFREYACRLQVGGSDQWFNILAGVDLIRRVIGQTAYALVSPLVSTASGAKMGKTAAGAVWLDPEQTSPYDFFQFWVNTDDRDVERFLKLFTFVPLDEIARLAALRDAELRIAKEVLAFEVTRIVHGEQAAERARSDARALFGGVASELQSVTTTAVSRQRLAEGVDIVEALVLTGLAPSRSIAKNVVQAGGVYVNDRRVERTNQCLTESDLADGQILLRRGKKEYRRIVPV